MHSLAALKKNWEGLARTDPLWAICTDPERRGGKWTHEELFATGMREVDTIMEYAHSLGLSPNILGPALDFGCGIGRLTRALARHFPECCGVDISPSMLRLAEGFHSVEPRCKFCLGIADDLRMFSDGYFGFIYSSIVLQHIPRKHVANYLHEFSRVLKPKDALVFQIADSSKSGWVRKLRNLVGIRRNWERLFGSRESDRFHMAMHCIPESEVRQLLSSVGLQILDVKLTNSTDRAFDGNLQFLHSEPTTGYVSKQYCAVKPG